MDEYLSFLIYYSFRNPVFDFFSLLFSIFFSTSLLLSFFFIYWFMKNDSKSFFAFISFLLNNLLILVLKILFARVRPSYGATDWFYSFPSAYAANAFFLATLFSHYYNDKRHVVYIIAFLVAFSRVYNGSHFLFDVLIGSCIGFTFAIVCLREKMYFDKLFNYIKIKLNL